VGALLHFGILGPLEVQRDRASVSIGGPHQRALLALLLCNANHVVSRDRLIDELFPDRSMDSADGKLRVRIWRLRKALHEDGHEPRLIFRPPGYLLVVNDGELDLDVFERLVRDGRQAARTGDPSQAAMLFREAEGLWRGRPLADLEFEPFARAEVQRLEELRLAAVEERIDADLAVGRHTELCPEVEALAAEHPLRERLHAQLMLALYRSGRQAEALDAYHRIRTHLAQELGLEPGHHLRTLQAQILKQEPSLTLAERPPLPDPYTKGDPATADEFARASDHHLRLRTEALIGRDRDAKELGALLADPDVALVTLTGAGGAGKTVLALRLAREVGASFVDGVTVVWLADISDPAQVLSEVARRFGVELNSGEEAVETLAAVLRFQQRLIVLDNFEHVLDAGSALAKLISECSQLKVLVTSRAPLRVSFERVYNVGGLAVPPPAEGESLDVLSRWPATALFIDRAIAADPTVELAPDGGRAISELCRYLGGWPLAIELAAARTRVLAPIDILARLRTASDPLGPARRDAPTRHRSLDATIAWSCALLAPDEQKLFTALGLFVGGFTVEAVEAVCAELMDDVAGGLATLLDHGLVQRMPARRGSRLGMLEPIREFALQRLRREGWGGSVVSRYLEYYARLAESARASLCGPRQLECLEQLDDELGNLRNVLDISRAQPALDLALQMTSALSTFWNTRDLGPEIRDWLRRALGQQPPGDRAVWTRAMYTLGALALTDYDQVEAMTALTTCLPKCYELGDEALAARCEANLAFGYSRRGDADQADLHAERALAIAAETGDPWTEARVLDITGNATGSYEVARDRNERALALYSSVGDQLWSSHIKGNLGYGAVVAGDHSYARLLCEQALSEGRSIWGASQRAQLEANLGLAALFEAEPSSAGPHLRQSLALSRSIGWWVAAQEALLGLATLAVSAGRQKLAATLVTAARAVYDGPVDKALHDRLYELLTAVTTEAVRQPAPTAEQLDKILREACLDYTVDETATVR